MNNNEAIELLKVAKADVEWNYPLDYQPALDKAIAALAAWDRVIWKIKIFENDCILGFCDFENNDEIECKKCKLNTFWSVRKIIEQEFKLAEAEVSEDENSSGCKDADNGVQSKPGEMVQGEPCP